MHIFLLKTLSYLCPSLHVKPSFREVDSRPSASPSRPPEAASFPRSRDSGEPAPLLRPRPPWPRVSSGRSSAPRAFPPCQSVPSPRVGAGDPGQRSSAPNSSLCWKTVSSRRRPSYCVSFAINKWAMGSAAADKRNLRERKTDEVQRITENGWRQRMAEGLVKRS